MHIMLGATLMYALMMIFQVGPPSRSAHPRVTSSAVMLSRVNGSSKINARWVDGLRPPVWGYTEPIFSPCVRCCTFSPQSIVALTREDHHTHTHTHHSNVCTMVIGFAECKADHRRCRLRYPYIEPVPRDAAAQPDQYMVEAGAACRLLF